MFAVVANVNIGMCEIRKLIAFIIRPRPSQRTAVYTHVMRITVTAFVLSLPCTATYIIVRRDYGQIIVGADSKVIREITHSNGKKKEVIERTECKIKTLQPDLFAAAAALAREPFSNYDAFIMLKKIASSRIGRDVIPVFVESVKAPLAKAVEVIDQRTLGGFQSKYFGGLVLEVEVFGRISNSVFADRARFFASSDARHHISIKSEILRCPGDCPDVGFLQMGGEEVLLPSIWSNGQIEGVRRALAQSIKGHSKIVGPPISIIKITPERSEWIEPGICSQK